MVEDIVARTLKHRKQIVVVGPEIPAFDIDAQRFTDMGAEVLRCKLESDVPVKVRAAVQPFMRMEVVRFVCSQIHKRNLAAAGSSDTEI